MRWLYDVTLYALSLAPSPNSLRFYGYTFSFIFYFPFFCLISSRSERQNFYDTFNVNAIKANLYRLIMVTESSLVKLSASVYCGRYKVNPLNWTPNNIVGKIVRYLITAQLQQTGRVSNYISDNYVSGGWKRTRYSNKIIQFHIGGC